MKSPRLIYPVFLLITLIAFYPTIGAGFVFDFLGWQRVYDLGSFMDFTHSFGYKGNHQSLHFFFYSFYSLFHIKGLPWYILFCSVHAFNAWLLYTWLKDIHAQWNSKTSGLLLTLVCILFLVHPYNVEPVVWKVCIHYLLSLSAALTVLILIPKYIHGGQQKYLWLSLSVYAVSVFLLELSYATPIVVSVFLWIDTFATRQPDYSKRKALMLGSSFWAILAIGLLLNKWTLGSWVGHYGAATHLNLDILGMLSTEAKYLVKHLVDARYMPYKIKVLLFDQMLVVPELIFFLLMLCIGCILLYAIKIRKISGQLHLGFFGIAASMLYVLPVSNLFFYHMHVGMNDRFSYVPLTFLLVALAGIFSKLPKWLWASLMSIFILVQVYLQEKTITYWKESTAVLHHLRDTFRWHDRSHVFVLNSPDNLNGIVMASITGAPSGIDELIDFQTMTPYDGIMHDVFQYNMTLPTDGVTVEQTGPMQLKVTFKQWGNWWHRNAIGASTYENEYYRAEVLDYPYQITFKQFPEGSVIIYQDGKEWKEFTLQVSGEL